MEPWNTSEGRSEDTRAVHFYSFFDIGFISFLTSDVSAKLPVCGGSDGGDIHGLADHSSLGLCSMEWKTTRGMLPEGLDMTQFEEWLFRE